MIEIPVHNLDGKQVDTLQLDEQTLGGEVRHALLKQAYVRLHANQRQGAVRTKNRSDTAYSTRKLYRQKGTGNARRGSAGTNIMKHGGMAFAKRPKSWRLGMPHKMRKLANRNALLAKAVDQEIKVVDKIDLDKPSTKQFTGILEKLKIDRTCLLAVSQTKSNEARSARNISSVSVTPVNNLNVFDLLNHRYLLVEKAALESWLSGGKEAE